MVNAAVAKASELGVSENVTILDDGGNLKPLAGWMGPFLPLRWRRIRPIQLCWASPRKTFFNFIQGDPSFSCIPTLHDMAAWEEVSH